MLDKLEQFTYLGVKYSEDQAVTRSGTEFDGYYERRGEH